MHNELVDVFTVKADVAPRTTFSSSSGRLTHHASQAQPDVINNNEEPEQEEYGQQEAGDGNNDALMAFGESKGKAMKKGYNDKNSWNPKDIYTAIAVLVSIAKSFYRSWKNSGEPII